MVSQHSPFLTGGGSVGLHLVSKLSRSFFKSAILMSPATSQQFPCEKMLVYGEQLMALANCRLKMFPFGRFFFPSKSLQSSVSCLQQVPTNAIIEGFLQIFPTSGVTAAPFAPCVDGVVVKNSTASIVSSGLLEPLPLLIGKTAFEGSLFAFLDASQNQGIMFDSPAKVVKLFSMLANTSGADFDDLMRLYNPIGNGAWSALTNAYGDTLVNCLCDFIGDQLPFAQRYVFDSFDPAASNAYLGATHANDMPFWFFNRSVPFGLSPGVSPEFPPKYEKLAERVSDLMFSFDETNGNSSTTLIFSQDGDRTVPTPPQSDACKMWIKLFSK
jgi:carboxylesterase type B